MRCFKTHICDVRESSYPDTQGVKRSNFDHKMNCYKNIFRTRYQNVFIFCMKWGNNEALQETYMWCLKKFLSRPPGGQKVKFSPKWTFLKIYSEQDVRIFLFYAWIETIMRRFNKHLFDVQEISCACGPSGGQKVKLDLKITRFENVFITRYRIFFIFTWSETIKGGFKTYACNVWENPSLPPPSPQGSLKG